MSQCPMAFILILTTVTLDRDVMEEHCLCLILSLFCMFSVISMYEFLREKQQAKNYRSGCPQAGRVRSWAPIAHQSCVLKSKQSEGHRFHPRCLNWAKCDPGLPSHGSLHGQFWDGIGSPLVHHIFLSFGCLLTPEGNLKEKGRRLRGAEQYLTPPPAGHSNFVITQIACSISQTRSRARFHLLVSFHSRVDSVSTSQPVCTLSLYSGSPCTVSTTWGWF